MGQKDKSLHQFVLASQPFDEAPQDQQRRPRDISAWFVVTRSSRNFILCHRLVRCRRVANSVLDLGYPPFLLPTMLPFGLKIAWWTLSFLGTLSCWLVLTAFAIAIQTFWAPIVYCVALTLLEGSFWLGLIWKMNPFLMPRQFCIVQSAAMGFSCFLLTATCATSTLATALYVCRPKRWGTIVGPILPWRPQYFLPMILFPCFASIVQITVLLHVNITWRGDDFACDVEHPEWARFVSYAGLPFLLTIPSFCLSTCSAFRVMRIHKHLERSRCREVVSTPFSILKPSQYPTKDLAEGPSNDILNVNSEPTVKSTISALSTQPPTVREIQLPFAHDPPGLTSPDLDSLSIESSAFPTFAPPSDTPYAADCGGDECPAPKGAIEDDFEDVSKSNHSSLSINSFRVQHVRRSPFDRLTGTAGRRLPPNLPSTIRRLIVFHMVFCGVQLLSSISTFIDMVEKRKTPTPFGTQHVALLLAAWGPVLVFGPLDVVRHKLVHWYSQITRRRS